MSRAANTLTTSDVLTTPIKLKYSSSYDSSSYYGAGIKVLAGVNGSISQTGSIKQKTLNYYSVRHLFYSNYLTGSYPVSASAAFNWEQSTAALGSRDADIRVFPTGSGDKVKILSIPRSVYGQKISRRSFRLYSQDGFSYDVVDDGNGNLIDLASDELYVDPQYFDPRESFLAGYVVGGSRFAQVGNIIYSQGIIIITNPNYYDILDAGPEVFDRVFTFYDIDVPKVFNPLSNAEADSSPIDTSSLALIPIPFQQFPSYTITTGSVELQQADPLYTTLGSYYIDYSVSSSIGTPSNIANITVNIIPNCNYTIAVDTFYYDGKPILVYDFSNQLAYSNSGSVIRDLSGNGNTGSYTIGFGNGTVTDITAYNPTNPGFLYLPSDPRPNNAPSVRLPNSFKFTGTSNFTFVAWINVQTYGFQGITPGIVAAEGESGGNPIGWAWYLDGNNGISATRYDGLGGGDTITLPWTDLGAPPLSPIYNTWLCLAVSYGSGNLRVSGFNTNGVYVSRTVASATSITSDPGYSCFIGQKYATFPQMFVGYVAGYGGVVSPGDLATIYAATKNRYP